MRGFLIALAAAVALSAFAPAHANAATSSATPAMSAPTTVVYALMQQTPDKTIDINISKGGGGKWYANPVWIGIGAVAIIVVLLLVVLAARGGGTTIVKE